jgi:hypothetical protein
MTVRDQAMAHVAKVAKVPLDEITERHIRDMVLAQRSRPDRRKRGAIMVAAKLYGYLEEVPNEYINEMYRQGYLDDAAFELIKNL